MNVSDTTIREATPGDFTGVADMHYLAWRRSWSGILTEPLLDILGPAGRWAADIYPQNLSRPGWRMWIAESGDRVAGVTILGPDPADPGRLQIDALYIAEDCQRRGLGGHLLDAVLSMHPSGDAALWCAERNDKAHHFYEKKNFRLDGPVGRTGAMAVSLRRGRTCSGRSAAPCGSRRTRTGDPAPASVTAHPVLQRRMALAM